MLTPQTKNVMNRTFVLRQTGSVLRLLPAPALRNCRS